jgi:tetratricopeptide (TPR) repeat protein
LVKSPLVGRAAALGTLLEIAARAVDFQAPQLVSIVGNQGTGKSRLIAEAVAALGSKFRVYYGRAAPPTEHTGERLSAIASLLRDRFHLVPHPDETSRLRFAHEVRTTFGAEQAEMLHFLGSYVGLEFAPSPFLHLLEENPRQRADISRTALRRFIEVDANAGPIVLVLDDLQWADEDTLALTSELAAGLGGSPVVLLCAARNEMLVRYPAWGEGTSDHERIDLRNLEPDEAEQMFRNLLVRCSRIPDDVAQSAVEMTGGNPAFLEQLVRLLLDNGTIDASGPVWKLDAAQAADTVLPMTIEEAIEARIAALERDERDLLEKAAVFGNVFWLSAVIALTRLELSEAAPLAEPLDFDWGDGERVRRRLSDLVSLLGERDYLLPLDSQDSSLPGDVEIVFKHNLERELIVRMTDRARSARYHLSAAQWLESRISGRSEEQLEFLAGLYERGGDRDRAARCYLAGAERARNRYAPEEARELFQRGLAMLAEIDAPARMDALHNLGDVLEQCGRSDEASERFLEMLHLAWRYDNMAKAGAAYVRLARLERRGGRYDLAMQQLRRAQELFTRAVDDRGIATTFDEIGRVHWLRGAYGQALDYHRQALAFRRKLGDRRSIALSLANIGRVHHDSGQFKAAISNFREALDLRRDILDRVGIVQSLGDLAGVYAEDGNLALAGELLTEARTLAYEIGDKVALSDVLSRIGEVKAAMGRGHEAIADLAEAKQLAVNLGDRVAVATAHQRLAQVHLQLGQVEAADVEAHAAVAVAEAVGLRVQAGSGYRVKGEVAAAMGQGAIAEECFLHAIDILAAVKHEVELARAFRSFADLKHRTGNILEAGRLRVNADEIFARLRGAAATER